MYIYIYIFIITFKLEEKNLKRYHDMTFKAESKFLNVQKIFKKNQKELLGSTIKLSNTTTFKSRNKFLKQTLVQLFNAKVILHTQQGNN